MLACFVEDVCPDPSHSQSFLEHDAEGETIECGRSVTFSCPEGSVLEGEHEITCGPGGAFRLPLPMCTCKVWPECIQTQLSQLHQLQQRQNPVVLFAFCSSVRNLLEVVPDRKLVSSLQTCVLFPVLCEDPGDRPFSTYHIPSNAFLSGKYLPGSEAMYTCDECYTGGRTIICENGTWTDKDDVYCKSKTPALVCKCVLFFSAVKGGVFCADHTT